MQTDLRRFAAPRLPLEGTQRLWLLAATGAAGLSATMLAASHVILAEARPETHVAASAALMAACAMLAWFAPRPAPAVGLMPKPALATAMDRHFRNGPAPSALILCEVSGLARACRGLSSEAAEQLREDARQRLARLLPLGALAAPWSEERLLIFLKQEPDPMAVLALARALTSADALEGTGTALGVNGGIAISPADGSGPRELLEGAELALAEASQQGTPGYGFFTPRLAADAERGLALQRAVKSAVASESLRLEFQPVYDMRSGELTGFEALLRLEDRELGPIRPSEFIPLAEREGHIIGIGQWALEEACRVAAQWPSHLVVAVNLSPAELLSGSIVSSVRRALQRHQLPAYRLEVEITEGTLMTDSELVLSQLRMLRDMGVGVALDDFGTGYSSLGYLCRFPFSKLKIDRSFAAALDHSASAKNVLRAIVRLGHGLGMTVTAEGIETERQLALLRSIGCDLAQGYLLGRPAGVGDLAAIVLGNFARSLARKPRGAGRSVA